MTYQIHPVAEKLPAMPDDEFQALVKDIKDNGLREPITVHDGMVIDGRHRLRACMEAGVSLTDDDVREWDGDDDPTAIAGFIVSANVRRRHLSAAERVDMTLDVFLPILEAEAEKRRLAALKNNGESSLVSHDTNDKTPRETQISDRMPFTPGGRVREQVAEVAGASPATVARRLRKRKADDKRQPFTPDGEAPDLGVDLHGRSIPSQQVADDLEAAADFRKLMSASSQIKGTLRKMFKVNPRLSARMNTQEVERLLTDLHSAIKFAMPYCVCPYCDGSGTTTQGKCDGCKGNGWATERVYDTAPKEPKGKG